MALNKGMDICYHQGDINFAKAKADVDFIIPRDGWGTKDLDPKLVEYCQEAKKNGIAVPGVYHFVYAINLQEVVMNAQQAIENVKAAGLPKDTIIWCDIEYDTVDNAQKRGMPLSAKAQREFAEAFCNYCLAQGYPTGIYLNKDYLVNIYGKDIMNEYDIWLADLNSQPEFSCLFWQYNWHGRPSGCPTDVDLDKYVGKYTAGTAKPRKETKSNMMKASVLLPRIHDVVDNIPTVYEGGSDFGGWNGYAFRLDCIVFIKSMVYWDWYYPEKNKAHGGMTYRADRDWTEINILNHCSNVGYDNFLKAKPCAYLYMDGHGGFKIDEFTKNGRTYNVAECTVAGAWGSPRKCIYSYVDNNGRRFNYKGGTQSGTWTAHGELYEVEYDVPVGGSSTPAEPTKSIHEVALEVIQGKYGNGQARKNALASAGYDYATVQAEVEKILAEQSKPKVTSVSISKFATYLPSISKGKTGDMVTLLQKCLKELGYYDDSIDGSAGNNTDSAIKAYQKAIGESADGVFKHWDKIIGN